MDSAPASRAASQPSLNQGPSNDPPETLTVDEPAVETQETAAETVPSIAESAANATFANESVPLPDSTPVAVNAAAAGDAENTDTVDSQPAPVAAVENDPVRHDDQQLSAETAALQEQAEDHVKQNALPELPAQVAAGNSQSELQQLASLESPAVLNLFAQEGRARIEPAEIDAGLDADENQPQEGDDAIDAFTPTHWRTRQERQSSAGASTGLPVEAITAPTPPAAMQPEAAAQPSDEMPFDADQIDTSVLDGSHPLMARVQEAIATQLRKKLAAVELEIRDKTEKVTHAVRQREDVGVTLYAVQQQLAKVQAQVEQSEEAASTIRGYREEAERNLKQTTAAFEQESARQRELERLTEQHKADLENVTQMLRQVGVYHEELQSKILVAKRTTLKAEEDLKKVEWEKMRQDYYVDRLEQQLRQLEERRTLYEVRIETQKAETAAATATLREAATEMEALAFEKRQLLHQWRSSVLVVQRRVEQIRRVEAEVLGLRENEAALETEIGSVRKLISRTADEGERLGATIRKLESEHAFVQRQIQGIAFERSKVEERYTLANETLQSVEAELADSQQKKKMLSKDVDALHKTIHQTSTATKKLEADLAEYLQDQVAVVKGNEMTARDFNHLRGQLREKEAMIISTENEVTRTRMSAFEVESRLEVLRQDLRNVEAELNHRFELVERFEVSIKKQTDELTKKQGEIDLLNKKIEKMTSGGEQIESMGPLEATIKNTGKLIKAKVQDSEQLQSMWLRNQTEQVNMSRTIAELQNTVHECKLKITVLSRKRISVNELYEREEGEIREHQRQIHRLELEMRKFNTLIVQQSNSHDQLQESTTGLEQSLRQRLKDAELDAMRLEDQIEQARAQNQQAVQSLVEAERQVMLWDKKIQLAKETRAALDPNIGANEISDMTKEIHRMKLRYRSMLKLQETMISEMERAIQRRETLEDKSTTRSKTQLQSALAKQIADLSKKHKQAVAGIKACNEDIVTLLRTQDRVSKQIDEARTVCQDLHSREHNLEDTAIARQAQRIAAGLDTILQQKQARRYEELISGKVTLVPKDPAQRQSELDSQARQLDLIAQIAHKAEEAYPEPRAAIPISSLRQLVEQARAPQALGTQV